MLARFQAVVAADGDVYGSVFHSGCVLSLLLAAFRPGAVTHASAGSTVLPSSSLTPRHKDVFAVVGRVLRLIAVSPLPSTAPDYAEGAAVTLAASMSRFVPVPVLRRLCAAATPVEAFDALHSSRDGDGCDWAPGYVLVTC